jgi:hypothetical protein
MQQRTFGRQVFVVLSALLLGVLPCAQQAQAVLLYASATRNTSAPTGTLSSSGWQYQGQWGSYLATPIAPHYFITALHVGGAPTLSYGGKDYSWSAYYDCPDADLRIWHINGTFSSYAPLYTGSSEVGQTMMIVGRGTQRGSDVFSGPTLRGWQWGTFDSVQSWGTNAVAGIANFGAPYGQTLQYNFDAGVANEGALSNGDSGGGEFVLDGGVWKLAGINFTADSPYSPSSTGAGSFSGSLFNASGFYLPNNSGGWQAAPAGPGSSYGTRISANLAWINGILAKPEPTWNKTSGGSWTNNTNWNPQFPTGADSTANFTGAITGASTITLDAPETVGTINFSNANTYTLQGPGSLTMQALLGPAGVNVSSGSHRIITPFQLFSDTILNIAGSSTLSISGGLVTGAGKTLTKQGSGTLIVINAQDYSPLAALNISGGTASLANVDGGATTVTVSSGARLNANRVRQNTLTVNGSVRMNADSSTNGVSNVKTLNIAGTTNAWTGKLDLNTNSMVVDWTSTSPLTNIINQIKQGFNGGNWAGNGITSSGAAASSGTLDKTALGVALSTDLFASFPASFRGQTVDNTAVLIRYTYSGDANLDGNVDSVDFNALAANFGQSGKRWVHGDFNYDGMIDTLDFNALAAIFGSTLPATDEVGAAGLVPEPSFVMTIIAAAVGVVSRRRRTIA